MPAQTPGQKNVWCAHCGKAFTRKEHLERHLPTHTNVKPHSCPHCQIDFNRKDLLGRHISTYHEQKGATDPSAGGIPMVAGRTPIACQNCASAKTGCDKKSPCTRCVEKALTCNPRFARRTNKLSARAAQSAVPRTTAPFPGHPGHPAQPPSQSGSHHKSLCPPLMPLSLPREDHQRGDTPSGHHSSPMLNNFEASFFDSAQDCGTGEMLQTLSQMGPAFPDESQFGELYQPWDTLNFLGFDQNAGILGDSYQGLADTPPSTTEPRSTPTTGTNGTRGTSIISSEYDFPRTSQKPVEVRFDRAASRSAIPEFEDVVKAEAAWPLARCNKPIFSGTCPRTGLTHLTFFEQSSREQDTWGPLESYVKNTPSWDDGKLNGVVPLGTHTRDKMLAITQRFLHKALEIHGGSRGRAGPGGFQFVVLPPSEILLYFLRSYVRSLSVYYPLVVAGCVDPNEMLVFDHRDALADCRPSTLLLLLMIAQGAAAMPVAEARYLSTGLTETCRISLFDIIEKNVELSADPVALRCALLFTLLGAWSGDKWLMDIAMGQRGMYMAMLKHAGMLEPQPGLVLDFSGKSNLEVQRQGWIDQESRNRLVYNWVMLDQELSLFHDCAPLLAIGDLKCPLPAPESMWLSRNVTAWVTEMQSVYHISTHTQMMGSHSPTSLFDLFHGFLQNGLSDIEASLTPQKLRLLLHPIQAQLCHAKQLLSCFPDSLATRRTNLATVTKESTQDRIREIQGILHQWYQLTLAYCQRNELCPLTRCNLVLYHLLWLNSVTNFPEIERLARREGLDDMDSLGNLELSLRHKVCIYSREEAILHCGQVLGLLRQMRSNGRPSWWTVAMYRAILVLWADSTSQMTGNGTPSMPSGLGNPQSHQHFDLVAIEASILNDTTIWACIFKGNGVPVLRRNDGSTISLDKSLEILDYGINTIDDADSSRIGDGIRRKLIDLLDNWKNANAATSKTL